MPARTRRATYPNCTDQSPISETTLYARTRQMSSDRARCRFHEPVPRNHQPRPSGSIATIVPDDKTVVYEYCLFKFDGGYIA
jgi:hypothetical protein